MRKIIHVDMDCFFAAVEMRENSAYRDIPLAVGGASDRRGVIATCNYRAREYGVRSAMPTAHALRLCPKLTVVSGQMALYQQVSRQIREIFARYTELIEPLSLDEAYLDVTDSEHCQGSATRIAEQIRREIQQQTGLTASAGVAPVKFIAKIASDLNKPDGLAVITPDDVPEFVRKLSLRKIPGVGEATWQKLSRLGLNTGADVQQCELGYLQLQFGKFGQVLYDRCRGVDNRSVVTSRLAKSVGVERTLDQDVYTEQECQAVLAYLYPKLLERLARRTDRAPGDQLTLKLKFNDFQQTTLSRSGQPLALASFSKLLVDALVRQRERGIRLIGITVRLADKDQPQQLALLAD